MNATEFALLLSKIVNLVPVVFDTAEKIVPYVERAISLAKSSTPPPQSAIDALHSEIAALTADILEPLLPGV